MSRGVKSLQSLLPKIGPPPVTPERERETLSLTLDDLSLLIDALDQQDPRTLMSGQAKRSRALKAKLERAYSAILRRMQTKNS